MIKESEIIANYIDEKEINESVRTLKKSRPLKQKKSEKITVRKPGVMVSLSEQERIYNYGPDTCSLDFESNVIYLRPDTGFVSQSSWIITVNTSGESKIEIWT